MNTAMIVVRCLGWVLLVGMVFLLLAGALAEALVLGATGVVVLWLVGPFGGGDE